MHWITLFTRLPSLSAFPNNNGTYFFLPLTRIISQLTNEASVFLSHLSSHFACCKCKLVQNKGQVPDTYLRSEVTRVTCLTLPFEHVPIDWGLQNHQF